MERTIPQLKRSKIVFFTGKVDFTTFNLRKPTFPFMVPHGFRTFLLQQILCRNQCLTCKILCRKWLKFPKKDTSETWLVDPEDPSGRVLGGSGRLQSKTSEEGVWVCLRCVAYLGVLNIQWLCWETRSSFLVSEWLPQTHLRLTQVPWGVTSGTGSILSVHVQDPS